MSSSRLSLLPIVVVLWAAPARANRDVVNKRHMVQAFKKKFGHRPAVVFRAPGRVNLIGEHTDYSNLPVLPMAINRGTWIAVKPTRDNRVVACSEQFKGEAVLSRRSLEKGASQPWHRYVVGALKELDGKAAGKGAEILVSGDLPATGGLSSSSALTVGLLAGLNGAWRLRLKPGQLARKAIVAERHVGVESGGMDQTVIALARRGKALRIDFAPTRARAVKLPRDLRVVVAYSGEKAEKGGAARRAYNERVVGCRLAAALLARELGVSTGSPPVLGQVYKAATGAGDGVLSRLPERASAEEVCRTLGADPTPLVKLTASTFDARAKIPIRRFARHVLGEARRVDLARQALESGRLEAFGRLLDASHASLDKDFGCSTKKLNTLCQAMRDGGALGARLTGAGFGGNAIAVCRPDRVKQVMEAARKVTDGPVFEARAAGGLGRVWW
jgi:galactokinase